MFTNKKRYTMKKLTTILFTFGLILNLNAQKKINGHEYVDLGLSVKWATCNVGATQPHQKGDLFRWGETTPSDFSPTTPSKTSGKVMDNISGNPNYDVARSKWGGSWRMPTVKEFEELFKKCFVKWTTQNGVGGCLVTGPNKNSIFLPIIPVADYRPDIGACSYWTSIPIRKGGDKYAYAFFFSKHSYQEFLNKLRNERYAIRPVSN